MRNSTRTRTSVATAVALIFSIGAATTPAPAHHSFAMYDQSVELTKTGRLFRFIIGSNHSQFVFDVVDEEGSPVLAEDGTPERWAVETGPATSLARQGITVDSFPIGTIFTVRLNPQRNGTPVGAMQGRMILCGMEMPEGGCTAETGREVG